MHKTSRICIGFQTFRRKPVRTIIRRIWGRNVEISFLELPKYDETDESVSHLLKDWCRYFDNEGLSADTDQDVKLAKRPLNHQDKEVEEMIEKGSINYIVILD